jgi:peptidoglycan/LPS O-acetylase OafA/YrhL
MMRRNHCDRPSVPLTAEERHRFAAIAFQLRFELDGLVFYRETRWHQGLATALARASGRSARWIVSGSWLLAIPLMMLAGALTAGWMSGGGGEFLLLPMAAAGAAVALMTTRLRPRGHRLHPRRPNLIGRNRPSGDRSAPAQVTTRNPDGGPHER